jgi:hypothetical protein
MFRDLFRDCDVRDVRARREINSEFPIAAGLAVVLGQSFSDLTGRVSDDGVLVRIVVGLAVKYGDAECPLLQFVGLTLAGLFNNMPQEVRAAAARAKWRALEEPGQLRTDLFHFGCI